MGLVFRPAGRAAALLTRPAATRLAATTASGQTKKQIYDGFILRAIGGDTSTVVQVLDTPVVLVYAQYNTYGPGAWPIQTAQYAPNRDIALRAPTGGQTPEYAAVPVDAENFVGFAYHASFITNTSFSGAYNNAVCPSSSGEWACVGAVTNNLSFITDPNGSYQTVLQLVSGWSKTGSVGESLDITPRVATQQAYAWDDKFLEGLTATANLHIGVRNEGSWYWSPYIDAQFAMRPVAFLDSPAANAPPPLFCVAQTAWTHPPYNSDPSLNGERTLKAGVFAAGVQPYPLVLDPGQYIIEFAYWRLAMLADLGIPELVPQASTARTYLVPPDPLSMLRNLVTCVGTVVGATTPQRLLFACTVDHDETEETGTDGMGNPTYTTWTRTAHYVLRLVATTGAVTVVHSSNFCVTADDAAHFGLPLKPDLQTIHTYSQCSVDAVVDDAPVLISYLAFNRLLIKTVSAAWPRIEHTDTDFVLLRDDGVEVVTGLKVAGYTVISPKYNGEFSVDGNVTNYGFTADADGVIAFDIGSNRIGVLATADQASPTLQRITLVVIDAITGAFVEARGDVASYAPSTRLNAAGSCVQRDTETAPGVFLVNINRYLSGQKDQYISNDGGWTWAKYRENVAGTPYYLGNQLHRAFLGHTI